MRVLVLSDAVGALTSRQAGLALAQGWPGESTTVVPVGAAGRGFVRAAADLWGVEVEVAATGASLVTTARAGTTVLLSVEAGGPPLVDGLPLDAGSGPLGEALARLLTGSPFRRVLVDLTGTAVHDGGAGLLGALGARADRPLDRGVRALHGLTWLDLAPVRDLLGDTELVGVVPAAEQTALLLGLRGITAVHGRTAGTDAELMLRTDATLERFVSLTGVAAALGPGGGACGGLGAAVLALGGRLTTGPRLSLDHPSVAGLRVADLVVSGCTVFDVAARTAGVLAAATETAGRLLAPCVVVAGEVLIGAREMRTFGVEAAYGVVESTPGRPTGGDVDADQLAATARRVARSWRW